MSTFLKTINYSSCNEDSFSEIKALRIKNTDTVLCITGSGARPLDLLTRSPRKIVSIDFNASQNFLLELKMAAFRDFSYKSCLEFFGVLPCRNRTTLYKAIRKHLSESAALFWDGRKSMIRKGILYQGRWERYFRMLSFVVGLIRPRLRRRLFNAQNCFLQEKTWTHEWDNAVWKGFLRLISSRAVWKYIFGDPGFYLYVPDDFSINAYFARRFRNASRHFRFGNSPFSRLLFFGKYNPTRVLPLYLRKEYYPIIKQNMTRIEIVTASLSDYLDRCTSRSFQKFSLSDFASYTDPGAYRSIWKGVVRSAAPDARVCERQFLVKRNPPAGIRPNIMRESALEKELARKDNSIFYTFVAAKIREKENGPA